MEYIVQKFGGTSLGNSARMIEVAKIIMNSDKTNRVIAVVSATSHYKKTEGTTTKLQQALEAAQKKGQYTKIILEIHERHKDIINGCINNTIVKEYAMEELEKLYKQLKSYLSAVEVTGEATVKIRDVVLGAGEKFSALILSAVLNSMGAEATYIDLSNLIDKEDFTELDKNFTNFAKEQITKKLQESVGISVLTGFLGKVPGGILEGVGRGYTDFTAALTAAAVQAEELQIWKEVDGIFTADPNKVPNAVVLDRVSPHEASELTYYGSEVIHPLTMEQVIEAGVRTRIKNTFKPEAPGTIIQEASEDDNSNLVTAVTGKPGITVINISSNRMMLAYGFMSEIFEILNRHRVVIDLIATSEVSVSLTVDDKQKIEGAIEDLKKIGEVTVNKNMAIISIVGDKMKKTVGTASKFFTALATDNISIEMISQGASEINISCVIEENRLNESLLAVHKLLIEKSNN